MLASLASNYHSFSFVFTCRLKSVSYDMLKQTGDWQCGGRTHDDHSAAFDTLFLGKVGDLSSFLETSAGMKREDARQLLCQLFQASPRDTLSDNQNNFSLLLLSSSLLRLSMRSVMIEFSIA